MAFKLCSSVLCYVALWGELLPLSFSKFLNDFKHQVLRIQMFSDWISVSAIHHIALKK